MDNARETGNRQERALLRLYERAIELAKAKKVSGETADPRLQEAAAYSEIGTKETEFPIESENRFPDPGAV
jgi:hypothetical protein